MYTEHYDAGQTDTGIINQSMSSHF